MSKFVYIESKEVHLGFNVTLYRWKSKLTGAEGPWVSKEMEAISGGIEHEELLIEFGTEYVKLFENKNKSCDLGAG